MNKKSRMRRESHVRICERLRGKFPRATRHANQETHGGDQSQVTLWDFSGYNSVTIENVPPLGTANANMQYFWEWSHYKTVVGGWILERILDAEQTQSHIPWDFGVRLTRKNIEAHLADIDHAREVYLRDNPEDVAFINLIVQ